MLTACEEGISELEVLRTPLKELNSALSLGDVNGARVRARGTPIMHRFPRDLVKDSSRLLERLFYVAGFQQFYRSPVSNLNMNLTPQFRCFIRD